MKKALLLNLTAFIIYLLGCSYFLFNHSGGADLVFMAFLAICIGIHGILVVVDLLRKNDFSKSRSYYNIFAFVIVLLAFISLSDLYLDFMWWFTSKF